MAWNDLASNQTVTFSNLKNAVDTNKFVAKTTVPDTSECITKANASTYVNIDETYSPYANKSSNQLVVKSNLVSSSIASVLITNNSNYDSYNLFCSSNIDPGSSGTYTYIQGRIDATLKDQNGNTITNVLGYSVYIGFDATATGCYNGLTVFSIEIPNGSSSGFVLYDVQKVDTCGDPDAFSCTYNTITIDCVNGITNIYNINGSSNLNWCGSPEDCSGCSCCY